TKVLHRLATMPDTALAASGAQTATTATTPAPLPPSDRGGAGFVPPPAEPRRPDRTGPGAGGRPDGDPRRDRRGQPDRVQALHLRRRARQLRLCRLRLFGLGQ